MESDFPHLRENPGSIWGELRWPNWLEIGVIVAIVAIIYAISLPADNNAEIQAEVDAKVAAYDKSLAPTIMPDSRILALVFDAGGEWRRWPRRGPFARIERVAPDRYDASFESGTCMGGCRLPRKATLVGGVLLLDQPVAEYHFGDAFQRLHAVRIGERRFLVPENRVVNFERALSADKSEVIDLSLANRNSYRPIGEVE